MVLVNGASMVEIKTKIKQFTENAIVSLVTYSVPNHKIKTDCISIIRGKERNSIKKKENLDDSITRFFVYCMSLAA